MRIGFIGGFGHHYLRKALSDAATGSHQAAVASDLIEPEAGRAWNQGLDAPWFDDPEKMIKEFRPDVISVGTHYGRNGDMIALALAHDIPVVSDKPVATSWEQLRRLHELTDGTRRVLLTEVNYRSEAAYKAARQAIAQGRIGQVVLVTAQKSYRFGDRPRWYSDRREYGGTVPWIAVHGFDWLWFTTGLKPVSAWGLQGNASQPTYGTMEDHTISVLALENGGKAVIHADYLRPEKAASHGDDRLRIAGSQGVIEILRTGSARCLLTTHDQPETDITDTATGQATHRDLLAAIADQNSELYSTSNSLQLARMILHARDAADQNCTIRIPQNAVAAEAGAGSSK